MWVRFTQVAFLLKDCTAKSVAKRQPLPWLPVARVQTWRWLNCLASRWTYTAKALVQVTVAAPLVIDRMLSKLLGWLIHRQPGYFTGDFLSPKMIGIWVTCRATVLIQQSPFRSVASRYRSINSTFAPFSGLKPKLLNH